MSESRRNGHFKEPFETIITPIFVPNFLLEICSRNGIWLLHPGLTYFVILTFGSVLSPPYRPQLPVGSAPYASLLYIILN